LDNKDGNAIVTLLGAHAARPGYSRNGDRMSSATPRTSINGINKDASV